jgi:hypothetical protein
MATIKTTLCAENVCGLKIENTTGYQTDNPTGFFTTEDPLAFKEYKLNDVYLYTFLVKNNWDASFTNIPLPGNTGKNVTYVAGTSFETLMEEQEITQHASFKEDGYYSVYQLAIPKESIMNTVASLAPYIYYVKESDGKVWVHFRDNSTIPDSPVDLYKTITSCTTDWGNNNMIMLRSNMVSKCFLEWCFNAVLEVFSKHYTDPLCVKDDLAFKGIRDKRDLLFAITNTIQYYVELAQYYLAAKLIHDVSFCNICRDFILESPTLDCNCHG